MSSVEFRLDRRGVREVLRSPEMRRMVDTAAGQIADHVRANLPEQVEVDVTHYTTDRAAASVTILDGRSMAWQANDGILTRAAGSLGVEVRAWQT